MKKGVLLLLSIFLLMGSAWGIGQEDLAVNILHDKELVKEINGQAALPFGDEYQVRLVNHNARKATAKVFIDGVPVSKLGDIIIPANGKVDLERFITHSLTEGNRFKFVPLTDSRVDDPGRKENGLVRVEFKLERKPIVIEIESWNLLDARATTADYGSSYTVTMANNTIPCNSAFTVSTSASLESGATIGGSQSLQKFAYSHIDVEDKVIVLELKLKGFNRYGWLK